MQSWELFKSEFGYSILLKSDKNEDDIIAIAITEEKAREIKIRLDSNINDINIFEDIK